MYVIHALICDTPWSSLCLALLRWLLSRKSFSVLAILMPCGPGVQPPIMLFLGSSGGIITCPSRIRSSSFLPASIGTIFRVMALVISAGRVGYLLYKILSVDEEIHVDLWM